MIVANVSWKKEASALNFAKLFVLRENYHCFMGVLEPFHRSQEYEIEAGWSVVGFSSLGSCDDTNCFRVPVLFAVEVFSTEKWHLIDLSIDSCFSITGISAVPASVTVTEEKAISDQQTQLQNKILDILNADQVLSSKLTAVVKNSAALPPASVILEQRSAPATNTSINFDNPSVQKALDNLIQSGPALMQNLNAISSSQAAVSTSSGMSFDTTTSSSPAFTNYVPFWGIVLWVIYLPVVYIFRQRGWNASRSHVPCDWRRHDGGPWPQTLERAPGVGVGARGGGRGGGGGGG